MSKRKNRHGYDLYELDLGLPTAEDSGMKDALLCGGVASSALFRRMLTDRLARQDRNMRVCFDEPALSGDNAVGVALIGADACRR